MKPHKLPVKKDGVMQYIVIAMGFIFLFLFLLNKKTRGIVFEYLAWFWFKFAVVIILLFAINALFSFVEWGFHIPINLFSIATITILGLPGMICISFLMIIKRI